jgi:hypothetical protein
MFSQYMIERAKGNNMDLSNSKAMAAMGTPGNDNPFKAAYQINASTTGAQAKGESQYIAGLQTAADNLEFLNQVSGDLATTFGSLNSWAAALAGSQVGSGAMGVAGSVVSGATNIASSMMMMGAAKKMMGGAGAGAGKGGKGFVGVNKPPAGFNLKAAKAGGVASLVLGGANLAMGVANGNGWGSKEFSQNLGMMAGGTIVSIAGSFLGPGGTIVGGLLGSMAGEYLGGLFGEGGPSSNIAMGASSGGGGISLMAPTKGSITAHFGQKGGLWGSAGHHGIDYGVSEGTPVVAAAAGTVSYNDGPALGQVIRVTHQGGYATQYAHLSRKAAPAGATVAQGDLIGYSGNTGTQTSGAHLHFELWQGGSRINPAPYLGIGFSSAAIQASTWGVTADNTFRINAGTNFTGNGVFLGSGNTSWTGVSDITLKNVTGNITNAVDKVLSLDGIYFSWKNDKSNKINVGLIAQQVKEVLPEVVTENNGILGIQYAEVIPLLVEAIKELKTELNTLKNK